MTLFQEMKKEHIEPTIDTINAYFQACGKAGKKQSPSHSEEDTKDQTKREEISRTLYEAVIDLPKICGNLTCGRVFREEELMSGWSRNLNTYTVRCPGCTKEFVPNLDVSSRAGSVQHYFLFPLLFAKEVNNLIEFKTISVFFSVCVRNPHA